jgi:thiol-disulfide isomerase/thioredoxin
MTALPRPDVARRAPIRSRTPPAVAALLLSLVAGCTAAHGSIAPTSGDSGFIGGSGAVTVIPPEHRAPPVTLAGTLVGGGTYDVAEHRGTVFLLNVWGSWCAPCRREAPELVQAWSEVGHDNVAFLGLNTRDDADASAVAFEHRFAVPYPSLRDPDGRLQLAFRTSLPPRAIPSTLILDKQGRVAARVIGAGTARTFAELVQQIRAEV